MSVKARIGEVCKSVFKPAFINCLYDMKFFITVNVSLMSVFILKQNPAWLTLAPLVAKYLIKTVLSKLTVHSKDGDSITYNSFVMILLLNSGIKINLLLSLGYSNQHQNGENKLQHDGKKVTKIWWMYWYSSRIGMTEIRWFEMKVNKQWIVCLLFCLGRF